MLKSRGPTFVNGLDNVGSGAHGVANVDAAAHARVHVLDRFEHIERGREHLVLGAVVVDGDANVVFLDEFFHARKRCRSRVAGDDDGDAGALGIFKLAADIVVFVLGKIDNSGCVQRDARGGVVGERLGFFSRGPWAGDLSRPWD
jgi:hypothetical protein